MLPIIARFQGIGLARTSPRPHAALLFFDFWLTEAQETHRRVAAVLLSLILAHACLAEEPLRPVRIASGVSGHIHPAVCVTKKGTIVVIFSQSDYKDLRLATNTLLILFAAFQVISIGLLADLVVRMSRQPVEDPLDGR